MTRYRPTHGRITGYPLPDTEGRPGRPPEYVSEKAKVLHSRLQTVEDLLADLARDPGFTYEKEKAMRGRLRAIANQLNRNVDPRARRIKAEKRRATKAAKLAKRQAEVERRENPETAAHSLAFIDAHGEFRTVCGFRPVGHRDRDGVWFCDVIITECAHLVDCPACLAAMRRPA